MSNRKSLIVDNDSMEILDVMKTQGFGIELTTDVDTPVLPSDITDLDDEDLIRLFQHINEFTKFVKVQVACAAIDESNAKKIMDMKEAELTVAHTQAKVTVSSIKAKVSAEPAMIAAADKYSAKHNYRKMMEMMLSNLESDMNLVSRELTRRTSSSSFKNRAGKFVV